MVYIFIGYALNSAYRFLVHKSEIPDILLNMIIEFRDVFFEDIFPYKREEDKTSGKRTHEMAFRDESVGTMAFHSSFDDDQHSCSYVY